MQSKLKVTVTIEARAEPYDGRNHRLSRELVMVDGGDEAFITAALWILQAVRDKFVARS